jgi:hypothetical protein
MVGSFVRDKIRDNIYCPTGAGVECCWPVPIPVVAGIAPDEHEASN